MKTLTFIICSLFLSHSLFSQKIVTVAERNLTVDAMKTEELYFGFAAGDQVVFNFSEKDNKDLKEVEILEYPYNSKFAAVETGKVENKTLDIATTGVYRFRFYNDAVSSRKCKIKIQRIPASDETEGFNTNVVWYNHYDTSYYTVQEQSTVSQKYVSQQIIPLTESPINSSNALSPETKSRIVFPIQLPQHTVEWYYRVSFIRDGDETKNNLNLSSEISSLIEQTGSLKFGPEHLVKLPGEAYCDVYVMDSEDANRFENGDDYKYSLIGSSKHIQSGITKVYGGSSTPLYLGIDNPESGSKAKILLECVAIVLNEEMAVKNVEKMNVASRMVPGLTIDSNISWAY